MKWISDYVSKKGALNIDYLKNNFPKEIAIELTNVCSHKCIHCPKSLPKEKQARPCGKMDINILKKIIDEAVLLKCNKISFCQDGDATLVPELLVEGVKYIISKDKNMKIELVTNTFNLTSELSTNLLNIKANYTFIFDIYAISKSLFKIITQTDHHDRCINNVKAFMKLKKKMNLSFPVFLQSLDYIPKEEMKKISKFGKSIGIENINFNTLHAYPGMDLTFLGAKKVPKNTKRFPCIQPFIAMNIFYTGDVTVCCLNYGHIKVGNIKDQTMKEIWTGQEWNNIRMKHIKNDLSGLICSKCDVWYHQNKVFFPNLFSKNYYQVKKILKVLNHKFRNLRSGLRAI